MIEGIEKKAIEWFVKLNAPEITSETQQHFDAWLQRDISHRMVYEGVETTMQGMDAFAELPLIEQIAEEVRTEREKRDIVADNSFPSLTKGVWQSLVQASCARVLGEQFFNTRTLYNKSVWYPAATFMLVALIPVLMLCNTMLDKDLYRTAVGEQQIVKLADGSTIKLNTDTELRVSYSEEQRLVTLLRGQAYFDVAKDSQRPFVVKAGAGSVTAIGTAFDVFKDDDSMVVALIEGKVEINQDEDSDEVMLLESAPEEPEEQVVRQVSMYKKSLPEISTTHVDEVVAWQEGKIIFDSRPLDEAITEVNRYLRNKIVIGDPSLKNIRISGVFHIGDRELVTGALEAYYSIKVVKRNDVVVLTAKI